MSKLLKHTIPAILALYSIPNSVKSEKCWTPGTDPKTYTGLVSETRSGYKCQNWDSTHPHKPKHTPSDRDNHNHCRAAGPDANKIWCYTTNPEKRWDYCNVDPCDDLHSQKCLPKTDPYGIIYSGYQSYAKHEFECQRWDVLKPNNLSEKSDDETLRNLKIWHQGHNFCRNPDRDPKGPWCWLKDEKRREYCDIPSCEIENIAVTTAKTVTDFDYDGGLITTIATRTTTRTSTKCGQNFLKKYSKNSNSKNPSSQIQRIVGGTAAEECEFPFMISIRIGNIGHFCGGSILNKNWILTAAHCITESYDGSSIIDYEDIHIFAGAVSNRWFTSGHSKHLRKYDIEQIEVHENWIRGGWKMTFNDIALIKVTENINFSKCIQPICLPVSHKSFSRTAPETMHVAGWGDTRNTNRNKYGKHESAEFLRHVDVPFINFKKCDHQMGINKADGKAWLNRQRAGSQICAGHSDGGKDACQGDSGGPMFSVKKSSNQFMQYGVVSWGIGCAEARSPGVYTNVAYFIDWINDVIG